MVLEHYGFEVSQAAIYIFVAIVPVTIDACFKLWVLPYPPNIQCEFLFLQQTCVSSIFSFQQFGGCLVSDHGLTSMGHEVGRLYTSSTSLSISVIKISAKLMVANVQCRCFAFSEHFLRLQVQPSGRCSGIKSLFALKCFFFFLLGISTWCTFEKGIESILGKQEHYPSQIQIDDSLIGSQYAETLQRRLH